MIGASGMPIVLPGPRPLPIVGHRGNKLLFYRDPIAYHRQVYQTYGTIAAFVQGGRKVLIYDPEYNRQVLTQTDIFYKEGFPGDQDSPLYRLGTGFATLNGDAHRKHRRLIMPFFHKQYIERYCATFVAITNQTLDTWQSGVTYDMLRQMESLTLHNSSKTLFGIDTLQQAHTIAHRMEQWIGALVSIPVRVFPFNVPGTPFHRLLVLSEELETYTRAWIAQERAHPTNQETILQHLIRAQDEDGVGLTDDELANHACALFFAGFETTAIALTWTLFLLAQHPQVIADLLDECHGVLRGGAPTIETLQRLPLLEMVIKESMRLLPPTFQASRVGVQPFELGPYQFPAGTKVMYSQYITHRLPDIYTEPQRFLPRRWEIISPSPYAYFPFLAGPRVCIGAAFAMMEMKIVLALLLQRYRLALEPNIRVDRDVLFFLRPKRGMPMRVYPQDRQYRKVPVHGNIHEMVDLT